MTTCPECNRWVYCENGCARKCPECNEGVQFGEDHQWFFCENGCGRNFHIDCAPDGSEDSLCGNCATRKDASWFHGDLVLLEEEEGDLRYEVVVGGTFRAIAPNGDGIKTSGSAADWLVAHGITNDEELHAAMQGEPENGWEFSMGHFFDLIVFEKRADGFYTEVASELLGHEFDMEMFREALEEMKAHFKEESQ